MEHEASIKIKEFSGLMEDFPAWRRQFKNAMVIANLQEIVGEAAPVVPQDVGEQGKLARKQARVYAHLLNAMDAKNAEYVENHAREGSGFEAWTAINAKYDLKDVFTIGRVRNELELMEL